MSQIFSKDAQFNAAAPALVANAQTTLLTTNKLTPPFGNCKAVVKAFVLLAPEVAATDVTLRLFRNPSGENVQLAVWLVDLAEQTSTGYLLNIAATDAIPDGRDVAYSVTGQQTGAGGNSAAPQVFLEAELISG